MTGFRDVCATGKCRCCCCCCWGVRVCTLFHCPAPLMRYPIGVAVALCVLVCPLLCWSEGVVIERALGHVHMSLSNAPSSYRTVTWWSAKACPGAVVEWGEAGGPLGRSSPATSTVLSYGPGFVHTADIGPLSGGAHYAYRVGNKDAFSDPYAFHMRVSDDTAAVRFCALGDQGVSFEASEKVVNALAEHVGPQHDFVMHVGDMAYAFGDFVKWDLWFTRVQRIASRVPYLVSAGNRDEHQIVEERFRMPQGGPSPGAKAVTHRNHYYSFDRACVHSVVMSILVDVKKGSPQHDWLKRDLAAAAARVKSPSDPLRWIVFFAHTPLYSSSDGHTGGNAELREAVEDLLVKHNVTLGFFGDDHVYERTFPMIKLKAHISTTFEGTDPVFPSTSAPIYLTVGTGGIDLDGWLDNTRPLWSAHRELSNGFASVVATPDRLTVEYYSIASTTPTDRFHVVYTPPPSSGAFSVLWLLPLVALVAYFGLKKPSRAKRVFTY